MTNGEAIINLIKDITGIELELEEKFTLSCCGTFKITQKGLYNVNMDEISDLPLQKILEVLPTIKAKSRFPKNGTNYYYIISEMTYPAQASFCCSNVEDKLRYKLGNFFLTCEEAEKNKDKWLEFIDDPEKTRFQSEK